MSPLLWCFLDHDTVLVHHHTAAAAGTFTTLALDVEDGAIASLLTATGPALDAVTFAEVAADIARDLRGERCWYSTEGTGGSARAERALLAGFAAHTIGAVL